MPVVLTYQKKRQPTSPVPEDSSRSLLVLGYNRTHSSDSRTFGFVEIQAIEGIVVFKKWRRLRK